MELGSNFSARLEPFLLMGKSMKGAAAAKLIQDATSAPGVLVFSELLELPNIQDLRRNDELSKSFNLLELFAYRTYRDYVEHQDKLPTLNQAQITKLKHLSLVSLAAEKRILPYQELMDALQTPTIRELEDLIIDAIYLDILRGKLDQKEGQLEVEYTMGRDLEPEKLESLLAALQDWASTTAAVLKTLDDKVAAINDQATAVKAVKEEQDKEVQAILKELQEKSGKERNTGQGYSGGSGVPTSSKSKRSHFTANSSEKDIMAMDVDEPVEVSKGKNRKAPQADAAKPSRKRNRT